MKEDENKIITPGCYQLFITFCRTKLALTWRLKYTKRTAAEIAV